MRQERHIFYALIMLCYWKLSSSASFRSNSTIHNITNRNQGPKREERVPAHIEGFFRQRKWQELEICHATYADSSGRFNDR